MVHSKPTDSRKLYRANASPACGHAHPGIESQGYQASPHFSCRLSDEEWGQLNRRLGLTARELDIVSGILLGHSEPGVAAALGISTNTVHTHLGRVYRKLGVRSVAGLILCVFAEYLATRTSPAHEAKAYSPD